MKLWCPNNNFLLWSTFRDSSMVTKLKYFWKTHLTVMSARNFSQKYVSRTIPFRWSTFRDSSMGTKLKQFWKTHETVMSTKIFHEICLTKHYFSCDPHFVILAWVQNWNNFEQLMKLWCLPKFFQKNMSHEQSLSMWSTFRDSSMGTKLKWFWNTWNFDVHHNFFTEICLTNN